MEKHTLQNTTTEDASYIEKITTYGNMPVAKFGHTATVVSKAQIIIFGGASGNVDTYSITNECFCLDITEATQPNSNVPNGTFSSIKISIDNPTFTWRKLTNTGTIPCSRAAHSCCRIEDFRML